MASNTDVPITNDRGKMSGRRLGWAFKVKMSNLMFNQVDRARRNTQREMTQPKRQTRKVCSTAKLKWKIKRKKNGPKMLITKK